MNDDGLECQCRQETVRSGLEVKRNRIQRFEPFLVNSTFHTWILESSFHLGRNPFGRAETKQTTHDSGIHPFNWKGSIGELAPKKRGKDGTAAMGINLRPPSTDTKEALPTRNIREMGRQRDIIDPVEFSIRRVGTFVGEKEDEESAWDSTRSFGAIIRKRNYRFGYFQKSAHLEFAPTLAYSATANQLVPTALNPLDTVPLCIQVVVYQAGSGTEAQCDSTFARSKPGNTRGVANAKASRVQLPCGPNRLQPMYKIATRTACFKDFSLEIVAGSVGLDLDFRGRRPRGSVDSLYRAQWRIADADTGRRKTSPLASKR
ncbi:hypothetical protein B0H13DRAFT_1862148 [Mycena leptocephala]|nr:hypothetical protein B0H13DRAFT_1862148 [Mycena leptocephala]